MACILNRELKVRSKPLYFPGTPCIHKCNEKCTVIKNAKEYKRMDKLRKNESYYHLKTRMVEGSSIGFTR